VRDEDFLAASFSYLESLYHLPILAPKVAGLKRIEYLLTRLGSPHKEFSAVHVTGTCGKGSTTTMIGSVLTAAGHRTGLFRSPHLQSYRERIAIGSNMIGVDAWLEAFSKVRPVADEMRDGTAAGYNLGRPSLFELLWAMSALHFAETGVELAIVEVGVGGRLSPTNVLLPRVAVLTNVSLDHTNLLGPTEAHIAREKAAIIKAGSRSCTAAGQPEVLTEIRARANEVGSPLWVVGEDVRWSMTRHDLSGETMSVQTPHRSHPDISVSLLGEHQVVNAATAIAAIDLLAIGGIEAPPDAVASGVASARFPGRFEIVSQHPTIILDGARNCASAAVLRRTMEDLYPERKTVLLIGVLGDKDAGAIVTQLGPLAVNAVVTQPPWEERGGNPAILVDALKPHVRSVEFVRDTQRALEAARRLQGPSDVLLVTGSLYLVGAVRELLLSNRMIAPSAVVAGSEV
jgi:dihydrofolate synthase/folylpolyglutamate synthase